jgi:hypothetical protein
MKAWIDTCNANTNIWLVLVFHGVDGVGWEAIPGDTLDAYFRYIKSNEDKVWVATFKDVTKYIRERMEAQISFTNNQDQLSIQLTHNLDPKLYDIPLTLKTYIPSNWKDVEVIQGKLVKRVKTGKDENGQYVVYQAIPNQEDIVLANAE